MAWALAPKSRATFYSLDPPRCKKINQFCSGLHRRQNGWHNSHCKIATGTVPCTTVRSVVEPSTRHFPCQIYLAIMQNKKKKKKCRMKQSRWLNHPPPNQTQKKKEQKCRMKQNRWLNHPPPMISFFPHIFSRLRRFRVTSGSRIHIEFTFHTVLPNPIHCRLHRMVFVRILALSTVSEPSVPRCGVWLSHLQYRTRSLPNLTRYHANQAKQIEKNEAE